MSVVLTKNNGIDLKKGSAISLIKDDGHRLERFCVGLNWGGISRGGIWKIFGKKGVDLDASVALFNGYNKLVDNVCYSKLISNDRAVKHSGDDLVGDLLFDDGLDNEVISIDLTKIDPTVEQIVFYLNSFSGQDFARIPYSKIRLYEGKSGKVESVFANFNLSSESQFEGHVSMVMAKLTKNNGKWVFHSIGEAIPVSNIRQSIQYIKSHFLA